MQRTPFQALTVIINMDLTAPTLSLLIFSRLRTEQHYSAIFDAPPSC